MGGQAAVAAGDRQTVEAAVAVLRAGGNAVDAALGAGFAAAVAEPGLTSLGGGGFLLTRSRPAATQLLDFFVDAPGQGLATGCPDPALHPGDRRLLRRRAGLSRRVRVGGGAWRAQRLPRSPTGAWDDCPWPTWSRRPPPWRGTVPCSAPPRPRCCSCSRRSSPSPRRRHASSCLSGAPRNAGDRFVNPPYADFLDQVGSSIPRAGSTSRRPKSCRRLMQTSAGLLTRDDLDSYQVRVREPHHVDYRGARLHDEPTSLLRRLNRLRCACRARR